MWLIILVVFQLVLLIWGATAKIWLYLFSKLKIFLWTLLHKILLTNVQRVTRGVEGLLIMLDVPFVSVMMNLFSIFPGLLSFGRLFPDLIIFPIFLSWLDRMDLCSEHCHICCCEEWYYMVQLVCFYLLVHMEVVKWRNKQVFLL